jgi:hypothetical protein
MLVGKIRLSVVTGTLLYAKKQKRFEKSVDIKGNLGVPQFDLHIPFTGRTIEKDTILVLFPNCAELDGSRSVQAKHHPAGIVSVAFEDRFRGRKSVHQ